METTARIRKRQVIERNGGVLVGELVTDPALGSKREVRYRVATRTD